MLIWMKIVLLLELAFALDFEFYGPANTVMVMSSRSVNLITLFLGSFSPLSGYPVLVYILSPVTENCPFWINGRGRLIVEMSPDQSPRK